MKKILFTLMFIFMFIMNANALELDYKINSYDINININENNSMHIIEYIDVNFKKPTTFFNKNIKTVITDGKNYKGYAKINNVEMNNEFTIERNKGYIIYKIGNEYKPKIGNQKYIIEYDYSLSSDEYIGFDRFYFDLLDNNWDSNIDNFTFKIKFPKEFDKTKVTFNEYNKMVYEIANNTIKGRYANTIEPLNKITIDVKLPDKYFTNYINLFDILRFIIPIVCIIIALIIWLKYGKDDQDDSFVKYHAPDGVNSLQAAYLLSGNITDKSIISLLLMFCNKGYIKIIENKHDFEIEKLKDYDGNDLCEKLFFKGLFLYSNKVNKNDLNYSFYKYLEDIKKTFIDKKIKSKFYLKNSVKNSIIHLLLIIIIFLFSIIIPFIKYVGFNSELLFPLIAFLIIIFINKDARYKGKAALTNLACIFGSLPILITLSYSYDIPYLKYSIILSIVSMVFVYMLYINMKKKNEDTDKIYSELKGLKRFIMFAKTDDINKLVNENPDYFYEILPYAYSFDLTDIWTNKFNDLAIPEPEWYSSYKIFTHKSIKHFINNTMVKIYNVMSNCPKKFSFIRSGHDKHV